MSAVTSHAQRALAFVAFGALVVTAPAALAGHLHGVVSETSNAPIPGTVVEVFAGASKVGEATSAADGTYAVDVADGTYRLVATPPAGSFYNGGTILNVAVSGDTRHDIVLALADFTVAGSVLRDDGSALSPGATIVISGPGGTRSLAIAADGSFATQTFTGGTYAVTVKLTNAATTLPDQTARTTFTLSGASFDLGADTQLDLRLPLVDATFVVKDPRGVDVPAVDIGRTTTALYNGVTPLAGGAGLSFTSSTGTFDITSTGTDGRATVPIAPTAGPLEIVATPAAAAHLVKRKLAGLAFTTDATIEIVLPDQVHLTGRLALDHGGVLTPFGTTGTLDLVGQDIYGNSNTKTVTCAADGTFDTWVNPQAGLALSIDVNNATFTLDDDGNGATTAEQWKVNIDLGPATFDLVADTHLELDVPAVALTFRILAPDGAESPRSSVSVPSYSPALPLSIDGLAFAAGSTSLNVLSTGTDGHATALVPATLAGASLSATATPFGSSGLIAATATGLAWPADVTHTITLGGKVALSGSILRAGALTPIPSVQLKILGPTAVGVLTPAADGSFSVLVEPGTYTVQLLTMTSSDDQTYDEDGNAATTPPAMRNADFLTAPATLVVAGATTLDLRVPLPTVCYFAHDPHGLPLSGVTITQQTYDADDFTTAGLTFTGFTGTLRARTGASGATCLDGPAMAGGVAANENLGYVKGGYLGGTLTDHVYGAGGSSIDLTLTRLPSLTGRVLFSNGEPPPIGAYVRVVEDGTQDMLDASGSFSFASLSAGAKHLVIATNTSTHIRQERDLDGGSATTVLSFTTANTLALALEQDETLELVIPVVEHSVTFFHDDGSAYLGNSTLSMPAYDVPDFTTEGLTFSGTAQHLSVRTGTDETTSWLAPLGAPGSSMYFNATPAGSATRRIDSTYPADGAFTVFVSDAVLAATIAESTLAPLGLVSTSDLKVEWARSNADGSNVADRWSTVVDGAGVTTTVVPDGSYRPHVKAAAHFTFGATGATRWAKSALETTATGHVVVVDGDTATTLALNTRRLQVKVQTQSGLPVAGVTASVTSYGGEGGTLAGVAWGDLTGSATAALGTEGEVTLVLPRTKPTQQLSLRVTPPAASGYLPVTVRKDLREDASVTIVLTTTCEPGTEGCDILCASDAECADSDPCTTDRCDPALGCQHAAFVPTTVGCGEGACAAISAQTRCDPLTGVVSDGCDDAIPEVATEVCDGVDNDCDGVTDNGFDPDCGPNGVVFYATVTDQDGEAVGTVRCFEDDDGLRCDTREDDPTVLEIHPGLVCPAD